MMAQFQSWSDYDDFKHRVQTQNRYTQTPQTHHFLQALYNMSKSRRITLKTGRRLWRAQIGSGIKHVSIGVENEPPISVDDVLPAKRMKPVPGKAKEGRINPKGIPCLYLSTSPMVAISEVRPWMGTKVTIGKFKIIRDQEIVVFRGSKHRIYFKNPLPKTIQRAVWSDVCASFTVPVARNDDTADYVPSQVIAEYLKSKNINGVAYKSAFSEKRMNIALFDINAAKLTRSVLFEVDRVELSGKTLFS